MCICSLWCIPCQINKLCCHSLTFKCNTQKHDINFKPYEDNHNINSDTQTLIDDYRKLSIGKSLTNQNCCDIFVAFWRTILMLLFMILFFPFMVITMITFFICFYIISLYKILHYFIVSICFKNYQHTEMTVEKLNNWISVTSQASHIQKLRLYLYKMPMYHKAIIFGTYKNICKYLAGLYCVKLIPDDMIIYYVHLCSITDSKFIYEYDIHTNKPIRIKGILNDYSSWSSHISVSDFFDGYYFEILSVYIDYDNQNRITFTLRNGEKFIQPKFAANDIKSLNKYQLDEMRQWNIIKAHYQCLISVFPTLTNLWTQFYFTDLSSLYIEKNKTVYSVFNRIIRSHTYYTSAINATKHSAQMNEWNYFEFICCPYTVAPVPLSIYKGHLTKQLTDFYFSDVNNFEGYYDESTFHYSNTNSIELVVQKQEDEIKVDRCVYLSKYTKHFDLELKSQTRNRANSKPVDLNANEEENINKHIKNSTMVVNNFDVHFIDPTHNTPNIPHNISLHAAPHTTSGGRGRKIDKIANGDIFPPLFVRNRLKMFHLEFENENWSEMHRGYSIYKDYLSDIYEIIYHEFVVLLYRNNFISNDDVKTWILFLEDSGFIGISQCQRNGEYLHILATFLWLNVVHSINNVISNNLIRNGICASHDVYKGYEYYKENTHYNFVDVLHGESNYETLKLQFYAYKNSLYWYINQSINNSMCLVADSFIDSNLYNGFNHVDNINQQQRNKINIIHQNYLIKLNKLDMKYGWLN